MTQYERVYTMVNESRLNQINAITEHTLLTLVVSFSYSGIIITATRSEINRHQSGHGLTRHALHKQLD